MKNNKITGRKKTMDNGGVTMVEVLMGFSILVLLLGMFSGIIVSATNMYYDSVDLRRAEENLQKAVYADDITDTLTPEGTALKLVPEDGTPGDTTPIALSARLYKLSSSAVLNGMEKESLDVDVYFLKPSESGSE